MKDERTFDPKRDYPKSVLSYARVSPLLGVFQAFVWLAWYLNFVEYLKSLFVYFSSEGNKTYARSVAIDTYMVLKWGLLLFLIVWEVDHLLARWVISYMISSAFFSYFYYHVWQETPNQLAHAHKLRRTLSFILSLFFSLFGYAYIIWVGFRDQIDWGREGSAHFSDALLLSLANAFTAGFVNVSPITESAQLLLAGEILFVFGFVVVVIVNSIPSGK